MAVNESAAPEKEVAFIDLEAQRLRLGPALEEAILRVVRHGQYIMGPEVAALERDLAEFSGARHVVSCASGTDALLLPLLARGVGPGDAVFVPAFTFAATAEVVALAGAVPYFVDVARPSFNMDPESLEAACAAAREAGLRPSAVIPVDLFGQPADYRAIRSIAEREGLFLLADAAQSFGARRDGRRVGTLGDATATSFFPAKPLGCYGDGGAVMTDDAELARRMDSLRVHGKGAHKYDNALIGLNARLDTMQAAVLIEKLTIFEDELEARARVAQRYSAGLSDAVRAPRLANGAASAWAQYTIEVEDRDRVQARLKARGVPTAVYYPLPLNRQTAYRDFPAAPAGTPVSDALAGSVLSLPMHPYLEEAVQARIIAAVRDAVG